MKITDEMVDAAYEAIRDGATPVEMVAALAPLILEAAAQVAESEGSDPSPDYKPYENTHNDGWQDAAVEIAAAIRTLKTK